METFPSPVDEQVARTGKIRKSEMSSPANWQADSTFKQIFEIGQGVD